MAMAWDEQEIQRHIVDEFYWLHEHPELSYEEFETTERIRRSLEKKQIHIFDLPLATGLVARVGTGDPPFVAVRCDIDALPVQEETDLPYRSKIDGKMHACGHDFHTAAVLGAAHLLKQREKELRGTVKVIFQPAEEAPGGALKILETGILGDVRAIFGLHTSPLLPVGVVGVREGAVMGAVDRFEITFRGKGTHAAHPEQGTDQIVAASAFVSAVQSIVSRNVSPFDANLVSITHFSGGNTWNVLPESVYLEGTMRTLRPEDRENVKRRICALAEGIATAYGARAEILWHAGPPATINAKEWADFATERVKKAGLALEPSPQSLGGEDFAFYQEKIPGVFFQIGTGISASNHSPHFQADPAALFPAARYIAILAEDALAAIGR